MPDKTERNFPRNTSGLLYVYHSGYQKCKENHCYGPAVRDHYLIHYILSGSGTYYVGEKSYQLKAGQGFLIEPYVSTVYKADEKKPWEYAWVGFNGQDARAYLDMTSLSGRNLVFTYDKDDKLADLFRKLGDTEYTAGINEFELLSDLFVFFSCIRENMSALSGENIYLQKAIKYINRNYSYGITITDVAKLVGLNRSYLFKLFIKNIGISPQQYLLETRLNTASVMLCEGKHNITEICYSCGFSDLSHFSDVFKSKLGMSPKKYREAHTV